MRIHPRRAGIVPAILLVCSTVGAAQPPTPLIERAFDLVRTSFDAENAFETTAFVEQFWRVPGNSGFNESIHRVESILERAGYVKESEADDEARLVYRVERRPMRRPTWEPVRASLTIVGDEQPLLSTESNRNLPLINSNSTPDGGTVAPLVFVGEGREADFDDLDVAGSIVVGTSSPWFLGREAIRKRGAIGILCYSIPDFNRPDEHPDSIPFGGIAHDPDGKAWGLMLSRRAYEALQQRRRQGPLEARIEIETKVYPSEELTIIARVLGSVSPDEQFVFSAHVQEPGANDNASGVGCQAEMARVAAALLEAGRIDPDRTVTFLWGDEISSTRRYVEGAEPGSICWGLSLDMVGEDTSKTGGTFLIEKMPDPSAVWPRGEDRFSEWGGRPISPDRLHPHYLNDFILNRCREQAAATGWVVKTNPYEGGSDHVPFLRAGIPAVLMWHFTDVYYHTDGDRIDMVSKDTLRNVGVSALVSALTLTSVDLDAAAMIRQEVIDAARRRLSGELELSKSAVDNGASRESESEILRAWMDWYVEATRSCVTLPIAPLEHGWATETHEAATALEIELVEQIRSAGLMPGP